MTIGAGQAASWGLVGAVLAMLLVGCDAGRAAVPGTPDPARGARVFARQGCAGCHMIDGQGGQTGPDLSAIGSVAATRQPGTDATTYLRQSIIDPNAVVVAGYARDVMPSTYRQSIQPGDLDDLIAYLLARR